LFIISCQNKLQIEEKVLYVTGMCLAVFELCVCFLDTCISIVCYRKCNHKYYWLWYRRHFFLYNYILWPCAYAGHT